MHTPASILFIILALAFLPQFSPGQSKEEQAANYRKVDTSLPMASGGGIDINKAEEKIFQLANEFRLANERSKLKKESKLTATAREFARFMAETHHYGHTADGKRPSQRAQAQDYDFCFVAENIGYQYRSTAFKTDELAGKLMKGWKNSPGHRANLLSGVPTETGIGLARSEKTGAYFAVQLFGRPSSMNVKFRVSNRSGKTLTYQLLPGTEDKTSGRVKKFELPQQVTRIHQRCQPARLKLADSSPERKTVEVSDGTTVTFTESNKGGIEINVQTEKESSPQS